MNPHPDGLDWAELRGYWAEKRVAEIAASGLHPLLLLGPTQAGKARLARSLSTLLPTVPFVECDAPASWSQALAWAQGGILFLHRLADWDEPILWEVAEWVKEHAGDLLLLGSMWLCPCGLLGAAAEPCRCTPEALSAYQQRWQAVLAAFALRAVVSRPLPHTLGGPEEPSQQVARRVQSARQGQMERTGAGRLNSTLTASELHQVAALDWAGQGLLSLARKQLHLTAAQEHKLRQIARTCADLNEAPNPSREISARHLAEAISLLLC